MTIKEKFSYYLTGIGSYFKDSFLLFMAPRSTIKKIKEKPFSVKLFLINLFIIVIIHSFLNFLVSRDPTDPWHIVNTIGLTWQIFVFAVFVISFSPFLVNFISSRITGIKNQFYPLSKVFLHVLIIFAWYPLINLYLRIFDIPKSFYLPYSSKSKITTGQIVEGILIALIAIFIIYYIYYLKKDKWRTYLAILISIAIIGISFPLVLYGLDVVYLLSNNFYGFETYGYMRDPAHMILWCIENMWFCLLILGFGLSYFIYQKKNYFKIFTKPQLILNILFPTLILIGYALSGYVLPLAQLISLIISSIAAWNFVILIHSYNRHSQKPLLLNKWETSMSAFWLLTIALSFSLVVSFISSLFLVLFLIISYVTIKSSQLISKHYLHKLFIFLTLYSIFLMGTIPIYIRVYAPPPSELALQWPTLFSFLIALPIAAGPSIFLKSSYFFPSTLP